MNTAFTASDQAALPCRLTLTDNTRFTDELISLTYTAGCSASTTGPGLGSTVAATFTAKLAGTLPALEGAYVTLEVQTGDDTWTPLGKFRFETPETGEGVTAVTAVDAMLWALEQGYYPSDPAPTTALGVLRDICDQAGVELGDVSGLTDVSVTGSLTGYTMREMAGYMAALLGRNALFGPDGKLELRWFTDSGASIGPDTYYSGGFTRKDYDWTISGLTCSAGSDEEDALSAGNPGSVISLTNPYMTQSILDGLWSELSGFSYRPGEVTLLGDLRLEPGDLVTVTDLSGSSYTLAVMAVEHSYDGGWKTKITAYGSAESDTGASYKGPTTVALERYVAEMGSFQKLFADEAYLQELFVRGGIVADDISAVEISASKYLTGVTIVGDVIQAGTLSAEKLILKGADGLIYELNAQAGNLTATQLTEEQYQNALDGSVLVAHSITADKINVTDLFAQDVTATGTIRGVNLEGATGSFTGKVTATELKFVDRLIMMRPGTADGGELELPILYYFENPGNRDDLIAGPSFVDRIQFQEGLHVAEGGITCYGNITSSGSILISGNYYFDAPYTTSAFISTYWADGARHAILSRSTDGLTANLGYAGGSDCKTVLNLRGQTVKVVNSSGTSTLSDERMKKDWKSLDDYEVFFDSLNPQAFRYIDGASGRYHLGFGAQSVEKALADSGLSNADFGGLVHYALLSEEENSQGLSEEYSLIYTEFVALLTDQIQKLKKKVEALERRLEVLEQTAD
ncbi:MAG: tail fiber domain-containing protein [Candidatus Onthomonas sp.]